MDPFISLLITFLASNGLIPPEVLPEDVDRQKTYLEDIPEDPDNVVVVKTYRTEHASMVGKEACIKRLQVIVRNVSNKEAFNIINNLYKFLLIRPEPIEYISATQWVIFDITAGPINLGRDDKGRAQWAFSFPAKTPIM